MIPEETMVLAEALSVLYGKHDGFMEPTDAFGARAECVRDAAVLRETLRTAGWVLVWQENA